MRTIRILRNTAATLDVTFYSGGIATDPDDGTASVVVTGADGAAISSGAATNDPLAVGKFTYNLAPLADLNRLTIRWTGTFGGQAQSIDTRAEIVGGFYVSLPEIRALENLGDAVKYPDAKLDAARAWFEDLAEGMIGTAQVPRFGRDVLDGTGIDEIRVRRSPLRRLISAKVDGVAQTTAEWDVYESGRIVRDSDVFTSGGRNVEILYEHGLDYPDEELREAALIAIRAKLLSSKAAVPDRATSMTTEAGTFTLGIAGPNRRTGIPEVDAVLMDRQRRRLMLA